MDNAEGGSIRSTHLTSNYGFVPFRFCSYPVTTGTSVVGLMFKDGVIIAADKLISYGSLARFHDVDRVYRINDKTVLGIGGDFADFQYIKRHIDQKV